MIPNIITVIRLLGIIPLTLSIFHYGICSIWQFIVFILIILTDFLDGFIARKYNMVTKFGKLVDPIVDKALVILITFALLAREIIPYYSLFIYIRDIYIMIGSYTIMLKRKIVLGSDIWGKIKTVCHFASLAIILLLGRWNFYSLILLILGFFSLIPETIYAYKCYIK